MRPYYNDPYTTEFSARVIEARKEGERFVVCLDKSYFYPTSGGQEHDTGTIAGIDVTDVYEEEDKIFHALAGEIRGGEVDCRIDKERRLENMQQHTGQHILSAAFDNLFGIETVSSRLGENAGTIDLSRQPTDSEITQAVDEANRVVRGDRPVMIHYAEPENISAFRLRKAPKVEGIVRIIDIQDFDMSPCGGTHCTHTSEVGVILTGSVEKVKSALTRIEFFCGERAIRRYYGIQSSAREASRLIFASIEELPVAVDRLKGQLQEKDSRMKNLTEKMLRDICEKMAPLVDKSTDNITSIDLSSELNGTDELRFVASCVSSKTDKSFEFHRFQDGACFMNLNLAVNDRTASSTIGELRSRFGVKGGGRSGFYSVTFAKERFVDLLDFVKGKLDNE